MKKIEVCMLTLNFFIRYVAAGFQMVFNTDHQKGAKL